MRVLGHAALALGLCVVQLGACGCDALSLYGHRWVLALPPNPNASSALGGLETHAEACNRHGLVPTERRVKLQGASAGAASPAWSAAVGQGIVSGMNWSASVKKTGCCSASLWCNNATRTCSTDHWGGEYYVNYGYFKRQVSTRILGRRTAPFPPYLIPCGAPHGVNPRS